MAKDLVNFITRHQVLLEGLKTREALNFAAVCDDVEVAIRNVLTKLDALKLNDLGRRDLTQLLGRLRREQERLQRKAIKKLHKNLEKIGNSETQFEQKAIKEATGIKLDMPATGAGYRRALKDPLSATGSQLSAFVDDWSAKQVAAVQNVVRKGWSEGWTVPQLTQAIRGTKKASYKDGVVAVSKRQAEAVARTSIQHISSNSRIALWEEHTDVIEGYRFVATLDGKTTQQCRSLDQRVFKIGEGPTPPVHINCRSTIVPELGDEFDFLDEGSTRSSKDGYVDGDLSYYEWLKTQPEAFQDEVLGPTRAKLFREGGLTADEFAKLNLGRNFQPLTLEQMRAKDPVVFDLVFDQKEEDLIQQAAPEAPVQNNVSRPGKGTSTGRAWDISDELTERFGRQPTRAEVIAAAEAAGINLATASTQYAKWRKFTEPKT